MYSRLLLRLMRSWKPICLSVHLTVHLSGHQSVCPVVCLSIRPCSHLSVHLTISPSIFLSIYLFVHPPVWSSVHLSVPPSISLSVCSYDDLGLSVCPFNSRIESWYFIDLQIEKGWQMGWICNKIYNLIKVGEELLNLSYTRDEAWKSLLYYYFLFFFLSSVLYFFFFFSPCIFCSLYFLLSFLSSNCVCAGVYYY